MSLTEAIINDTAYAFAYGSSSNYPFLSSHQAIVEEYALIKY